MYRLFFLKNRLKKSFFEQLVGSGSVPKARDMTRNWPWSCPWEAHAGGWTGVERYDRQPRKKEQCGLGRV